MSEGTKIALAIIAVGVIGFLVYEKVSAPTVVPKNTAPAPTTASWVSGIVSGVASLWKTPAPATTSPNAPLTNIGVPAADTTAYNTSPDYNASQGDYGPYLPSSSLPSS
jgi:uncharacterized membrane protein